MSDLLRRAVIPHLEATATPYLLDPHSGAVALPFEAEQGIRQRRPKVLREVEQILTNVAAATPE